jgi:hypothetical protein
VHGLSRSTVLGLAAAAAAVVGVVVVLVAVFGVGRGGGSAGAVTYEPAGELRGDPLVFTAGRAAAFERAAALGLSQ